MRVGERNRGRGKEWREGKGMEGGERNGGGKEWTELSTHDIY